MRTRNLGSVKEDLTVIGLGAWAMGGGAWAYGWGPQDDEDSISAIHRALDLGINWIDTAAVYGLGHAEEVVGAAIKGRRDKVFLATKCGLSWNRKGRIKGRTTAKGVRSEVEDSLRRLDTDYIDLYQIHWPTNKRDDADAWGAMGDLVQEGKIRYAGLSNFSVEQMEAIRPLHPPASLQPPYSMIERGVEQDILPYCAEHSIGVVAYSPMQCGLLTGKMTSKRRASLPKEDWRVRDRQFNEPAFSATMELVEGLKEIASAVGRTPAQMAVAWVLRRDEVTSAIVGARRPDQIEEVAKAADWDLSPDEIAAVERLLEARASRLWSRGEGS